MNKMVTYMCRRCNKSGALLYIWTHDQGQHHILLCDGCAEIVKNDPDTISLKIDPKPLEELIQ